jgi:murein DD-endopeptidase MepM/ murein hydrolase activator NlpD
MELPIKYKIENKWLWYTRGPSETWTKGFYLYESTVAGVLNQGFGSNIEIYKQFGMNGHNGLDLYAPDGACLYSPLAGQVTEIQIDPTGYGNHIRIGTPEQEQVFGHLKEVFVKTFDKITEGQLIGLCDNTGFSSGSHLHWGKRLKDKSGSILNYNNGYFGYVDFSSDINLTIKETNDLKKLQDYATTKGDRYGYFFGWGGSDRLLATCKTLGITGRVTQSQYYQFILFNK